MATYSVHDNGAAEDGGQPVPLNCRQLVASDLRAWMKLFPPGKPVSGLAGFLYRSRLIWVQCGLRATLVYRFSYALSKNRVPALPGMLYRLNIFLHGFDTPPSVEIGPGLYVPHPVGTVIMAKRIGSNVSLISNITIGMRNVPRFPTIGNDVFIGAGARILGEITIGNNVNIGANAVVLKDVPSGATAVGVPARLLPLKDTEE